MGTKVADLTKNIWTLLPTSHWASSGLTSSSYEPMAEGYGFLRYRVGVREKGSSLNKGYIGWQQEVAAKGMVSQPNSIPSVCVPYI